MSSTAPSTASNIFRSERIRIDVSKAVLVLTDHLLKGAHHQQPVERPHVRPARLATFAHVIKVRPLYVPVIRKAVDVDGDKAVPDSLVRQHLRRHRLLPADNEQGSEEARHGNGRCRRPLHLPSGNGNEPFSLSKRTPSHIIHHVEESIPDEPQRWETRHIHPEKRLRQ